MQSPDSNQHNDNQKESLSEAAAPALTSSEPEAKSTGSSKSISAGLGSILIRLMGAKATEGRILLVSYPKIVFLYPTVIISLLCAVVMSFAGDATSVPVAAVQDTQQEDEAVSPDSGANAESDSEESPSGGSDEPGVVVSEGASLAVPVNVTAEFCGRFFMFALLLNLVVIGFDFPRTASFTIFFGCIAVGALIYSLVRMNESFFPALLTGIVGIKPVANATFYYAFFIGMTVMFLAVAVTRRFDYWEVSGNELLHHQGFLSNLKRYPSPNLRIDKEINDVFEFILLRSGRLILQPSTERTAIVLENVINISKKEERISEMLKQLDVRVR